MGIFPVSRNEKRIICDTFLIWKNPHLALPLGYDSGMADISIARLSAVLPATELVPVLQNEIERLRLTDREREALRTVIGGFGMWVAQNGLADDESLRLAVVALRSLLERHCSTPENPPPQDNAPETHSNQSEVSVQDSDT